jgi:hypothetical protein
VTTRKGKPSWTGLLEWVSRYISLGKEEAKHKFNGSGSRKLSYFFS